MHAVRETRNEIDLTTPLVELGGAPVLRPPRQDEVDAEGKPLGPQPFTLREMLVNALSAVYQGENPDGMEKMKRLRLARRCFDAAKPIAFTVEEIVLLKKLVDKCYTSPILSGQEWEILDPAMKE